MITRDQSNNCSICKVGLATAFGKSKQKLERPCNNDAAFMEPTPKTVCSFVWSEITPGLTYICSSSTREPNILKTIGECDKTGDKFASAILKQREMLKNVVFWLF